MTRDELIEACDAALDRLRRSNRLESAGTPTDLIERGAIMGLDYLRDELVKR